MINSYVIAKLIKISARSVECNDGFELVMSENRLKSKLSWQCRRGMLELDVILMPFLAQHYDQLNAQQQSEFELLLNEADPDLYTWIMGFGECENPQLRTSVKIIREKMNIES